MGQVVEPDVGQVGGRPGGVGESDVDGVAEPIEIFPGNGGGVPRRRRPVVQLCVADVQNSGVFPESETVFCVVKPDKIPGFGQTDLSNQRNLKHQPAEGAHIVEEGLLFIGALRHGGVKHQTAVGQQTAVGCVNDAAGFHGAGVGQIPVAGDGVLNLLHVSGSDDGVVVDDEYPVAVSAGDFL